MKPAVLLFAMIVAMAPIGANAQSAGQIVSPTISRETPRIVSDSISNAAKDALKTDPKSDEMKEKAEKKGFTFPYLYDESQQIADKFGATYTPEFFVANADRKIVYMGAMDDNSNPTKVTRHYLHQALAAALTGTEAEVKETVAVGCRIRVKRRR